MEMKCPVCLEQNLESSLRIGNHTTTLMSFSPYYDEKGKYHDHDDNHRTTEYFCSNNHRFIHQPQPKCWCGWKGRDEYLHIIEDEPNV
jgi:hypothetical protein